MSSSPNGFIPPHGGYQNLMSYQMAEIVYDATVYFVINILINFQEPMIKWCKQQGVENKILQKAAWHRALLKKLK